MFRWLNKRREYDGAVQTDAELLIAHYGTQACLIAAEREATAKLAGYLGDWPPKHWKRVRRMLRDAYGISAARIVVG